MQQLECFKIAILWLFADKFTNYFFIIIGLIVSVRVNNQSPLLFQLQIKKALLKNRALYVYSVTEYFIQLVILRIQQELVH